MKLWTKVFDRNEPRTAAWQLCLLRDRALAAHRVWADWKQATESQDGQIDIREGKDWRTIDLTEARERMDAAHAALYPQCSETDVFISGLIEGRKTEEIS